MSSHTIETIKFKATAESLNGLTIVRLPIESSQQLATRGQLFADLSINGRQLNLPLNPDGKGGHWLNISEEYIKNAAFQAGSLLTIELTPSKSWPEPIIPKDLVDLLNSHPSALSLWKNITPMARWEWIRWIGGSAQAATRQKRLQVGIDKLEQGKRRPCCWNRNECSEPRVAKGGVLIEPSQQLCQNSQE